MKPSIRTKIGLLCSIFIVFLLLMGSSLLWNLSGVVELFRISVEISGKAIKDAQLLQQAIIDAETPTIIAPASLSRATLVASRSAAASRKKAEPQVRCMPAT